MRWGEGRESGGGRKKHEKLNNVSLLYHMRTKVLHSSIALVSFDSHPVTNSKPLRYTKVGTANEDI